MLNLDVETNSFINDLSRDFAIYSGASRAIPFICDGLKDAPRRIFWALKNKTDKIKTVSLSGVIITECSYNHGDASASATISLLAAPFCNNNPLLEGIGTFGTRVAPVEGIASPRYTYVKKGKTAQELVYPDLDILPLKENYDGSKLEPVHFLPLIPLILLNGISGISVGWSTEVLPRSLTTIIDATLIALSGGKVERLIPSYEYLFCSTKHIEGNTWEFSGKTTIVDTSTIKVTELPPDLTLEKFKERLNSFEDQNKINSYTDRSTKTIDVTIKFPRGSIKDWTEDQAIDFLKLRQKKTERIVAIDWNCKSIRQYESAEQVVEDFVKWRLKWFTVRYQTKLDADNYELLYWKAVKLCFEKKLPARLGSKLDKKDVESDVTAITKSIGIDDKQVDRLVGLPTHRWAQDGLKHAETMITELEGNIATYKSILSDDKKIKDIYKKELMALKKIKF